MAIKLKNQLPGVQFAVFFGLTVAMILFNLLINSIFFADISSVLTDKNVSPAQISKFKWFQFASTFLIFVMPALIYGYLSDDKPLRYVGLKRESRIAIFGLTLVLLVSIQPFAMLLGQLNQQADFGETFRKLEELSEKALQKFLVMNSTGDLLVNILVVAILPAIGEELFFRGSLQNILERWTQRPVAAIILSSFFFAFFHFSVFKFLPIFVLGVVLGTLFYITRNLWYSIFFHFVNNTMALLASYYSQKNDFMKQLANDEVKFQWWMGLTSLLITILIFYYMRKKNPPERLEKTWQMPVF
ncbi:MAG TPA: type II CAAX endopeptidase family protein [Chitinophagaceae bacterium]